MNTTQEDPQKYATQLLADLGLDNLEGKEREAALHSLQERFHQVIFNTTVRVLPEEQKLEYLKAVQDPEKNETKIVEITSQAEGLAEAIEAALLLEFESLKHAMKK